MSAPDKIWYNGTTLHSRELRWCAPESDIHPEYEYTRSDLIPQWQPIESAPRDGTDVLLLVYGVIGIGWRYNDDYGWISHDGDFHGSEPTHWQPLPAPPHRKPE